MTRGVEDHAHEKETPHQRDKWKGEKEKDEATTHHPFFFFCFKQQIILPPSSPPTHPPTQLLRIDRIRPPHPLTKLPRVVVPQLAIEPTDLLHLLLREREIEHIEVFLLVGG